MNNVSLVGRLTRDPDVKTSSSGTMIAQFSVAVDRRYKDKTTGEYGVDFPNIVAFGSTAEFIQKYFRKGQRIGIVGRIQTRSWEADDGTKRYATEVIAENVEFVESKKSESQAPAITEVEQPNFESDTELPFDL